MIRTVVAVLFLATMSSCASAQEGQESYWLLASDDGHTWCGYKDSAKFTLDAGDLKPLESARITYSSGKLIEITYQIQAESGDWIVVDKYTPTSGEMVVRRANLLTQEKLQIVQEATIHDGKAGRFHLVSVTTLDGKKADASILSKIDFPEAPVKTSLSSIPFLAVVTELRSQSGAKLCKKLE